MLDPKTGAIKSGWGSDMFYMPHGMTIDGHGNYWITDVAMHQAFKVGRVCIHIPRVGYILLIFSDCSSDPLRASHNW